MSTTIIMAIINLEMIKSIFETTFHLNVNYLFGRNTFFLATLSFGPYLRGRPHLPPVNRWILFWY